MTKFPFSLLGTLIIALLAAGQLAVAQTVKPLEAGSRADGRRVEVRSTKMLQIPVLESVTELSFEQLAIADRVALGKMPCELAAYVNVKLDARGAGRFILEMGRQKYFMVPVPTLTGAIRLEDAAAGAVWLQLSNKSMLMSQKFGKRLADDCTSTAQQIVAKELERNPAPSLLDAPVPALVVVQAGIVPTPEIALAADEAAN